MTYKTYEIIKKGETFDNNDNIIEKSTSSHNAAAKDAAEYGYIFFDDGDSIELLVREHGSAEVKEFRVTCEVEYIYYAEEHNDI